MADLPSQRRLIVMRHAKSSHDTEAATDHERPLNKRGRRDTPKVARYLRELGWAPDFVLASDSRRTRETLEGLYVGWDGEVPHALDERLYCGGYDELLLTAGSLPHGADTVLALGHNPGWEHVVERLTDEAIVLKTATAALLVYSREATWVEALRQAGAWWLENVVYPREIPADPTE